MTLARIFLSTHPSSAQRINWFVITFYMYVH